MPTLYQILHGKMTRKNAKGEVSKLVRGDKFVPSPSELSAEKYRLKPVGTVDWNHPEAQAAIANTNTKDYPDFGPESSTTDNTFVAPEDSLPEDIRAVKDLPAALKVITSVVTEEALDTYLLQEADNKPKVRKAVIGAIEARRIEISKATEASA